MDTKPGINFPLIAAIVLLVVVSAVAAAAVVSRRFSRAMKRQAEQKDAEPQALAARLYQSQEQHRMLLELTEPVPAVTKPVVASADTAETELQTPDELIDWN